MLAALPASAQDSSNPPYTVTDLGPYYRVWQRTVMVTDSLTGEVTPQVQGYTELGDGMNYWVANGAQGQWAESQDLIEPTPTGAQAVHGQVTANFSGDITVAGAITLTTPSGQLFQSHPVGLYYSDSASGKVAQIGLVQPSPGLLYAPNVIVFTNVLSSPAADLMLVWAKNGFEQNLVLKQAPPPPESFGLSSATCRLQMWTALDQWPDPVEERPAVLGSGLVDHILIFNECWFPVGAAFAFGAAPLPPHGQAATVRPVSPSDTNSVPTAKSLVTIAGQKVLVEEINYADLLSSFRGLSHASLSPTSPKAVELAARGQLLPAPAGRTWRDHPIVLASGRYRPPGVVLDYVTLSGSASSYTFTNGTTYHISGNFYQGPGTATFQNNACLKFASNVWLIAYGPVSFPSSGAPVIFTSADDNAYGNVITNSAAAPHYAASQALWLYYNGTMVTVQNALFRWAQYAIECDANPGSNNAAVYSSTFEDCSIGLYVNMPSDTLYLSGDTYCNVATPVSTHAGTVSGSMTADCGTPNELNLADASQMSGIEGEPAITVNPVNPLNIFVAANGPGDNTHGVIGMTSTNGGTNWATYVFTNSFCDPSAAFDRFGNLFVSYITNSDVCDNGLSWGIAVVVSTNGGNSFTSITNFSDSGHLLDQPTITTGPGGSTAPSSVWLTAYDFFRTGSVVAGAAVAGLGQVGNWTPLCLVPGTDSFTYGDIAIGPTGQVAVVCQCGRNNGPTSVGISVNPNGLANYTNFPHIWTNVTSNAGEYQTPPAAPNRGCDVEPGLAWDRTGGQYSGRLYMVYTDRPANATNNLNTFVIYSGDSGTTWSAPVQVNATNATATHFDPRIALDQTSGKVAASWYDCRDDPNNVKTKFYAAVSSDGGLHWSSNIALEPGQSCATNDPVVVLCPPPHYSAQYVDYYDYTGLAYYGGYFYSAWADNSNNPPYNKDGTNGMDILVSRVKY